MKTMMLITILAAAPVTPQTGSLHVALSVDACMACHTPAEKPRLEERLTRPCAPMCLSCHTKLEGHHPVGVKIGKRVPAPLLLTAEGRNTCSTCHDLSVRATDAKPWRSQPLIQWIARGPKEHSTYLLVMRNNRGQLCRNCH